MEEEQEPITNAGLWSKLILGLLYGNGFGYGIYFFLKIRLGLDGKNILAISISVGSTILFLYLYIIYKAILLRKSRRKTIG